MSNYVTVTSDKKKWVAFFLCLFLGCFGAHYSLSALLLTLSTF